jgi:A/G-specific adenine glycosylase
MHEPLNWTPGTKQQFRRSLVRWFRKQARDLPWRRTREAYAIWVSEIMLQQTQVVTVIPYYERFMARFPNLHALAAATEQDVLAHWEGLGYYGRARQMHAAAKTICATVESEFPADPIGLQSLPGIGKYTAYAILSFSQGQRLPVLESNTVRLWCRLLGFAGDPARSASLGRLWDAAGSILPRGDSSTINQALMELGSLVCRPNPECPACPVKRFCTAFQTGQQHLLPRRTPRMKVESITEVAVVIQHHGRTFVRQCSAGERWAGLWDYPRAQLSSEAADCTAAEKALGRRSDQTQPVRLTPLVRSEIEHKVLAQTGLRIRLDQHLITLRHGVTRFRITLICFRARLAHHRGTGRLAGTSPTSRWLLRGELAQLPQHVTARTITNLLGQE